MCVCVCVCVSVCLHSDYKEYHTDTTVRFVVNVTAAKTEKAAVVGLYKKFKMESSISTANMVGTRARDALVQIVRVK